MTMEKFAAAMREARARKKMSQKELSEKSGVATSTISSYENGGKVPPLDIAAKLARVLEISIDEIWGIASSSAVKETPFAQVIHALEALIDSDIAGVRIIPIHSHGGNDGFDAEIQVRQAIGKTGGAEVYDFARKWNILLEGRKNDLIFGEVYAPWVESQVKEIAEKRIEFCKIGD